MGKRRKGAVDKVEEVSADEVDEARRIVLGNLERGDFARVGLPPAVLCALEKRMESSGARGKKTKSNAGRKRARQDSEVAGVDLYGVLGTLPGDVDTVVEGELVGMEDLRQEVGTVLRGVLDRGENQSCLVLGAPGSGKSMIVEQALRDLYEERVGGKKEEVGEAKEGVVDDAPFLVVHLDGASTLDDAAAVRELCRQLAVDPEAEMAVEEARVSAHGSKSVSSKGGRRGRRKTKTTDDAVRYAKGSVERHVNRQSWEASLDFVIASLREGRLGRRPVFVVIDSFGIFARRTRQALLYSLLDLMHDADVHFALIGMDPRVDVTECLEKRLRSRFSHRSFLTRPLTLSEMWTTILRAVVPSTLPESTILAHCRALADPSTTRIVTFAHLLGARQRWIKDWISYAFVLAHVRDPSSPLTAQDLQHSATRLLESWRFETASDLELVPLSLLVAAARLDIAEPAPRSFGDIYGELFKWTNSRASAGLRPPSRHVAARAFDRLVHLDLIRPIRQDDTPPSLSWTPCFLTIPALQVVAIAKNPNHKHIPDDLRQWAQHGIIA